MESIANIYSFAVYEIYEPQIILSVGKKSEMLDTLLSQHGEKSWAFITPYNPYPDTLADEENLVRFAELESMLTSYSSYQGEGRGNDEHPCVPERSILVLGISLEEAKRIGNYFHQKAILAGVIGGAVKLVVLFD